MGIRTLRMKELGVDIKAHGSDGQLEQYAMGRLPDPETCRMEEHLLACQVCRDRLDQVEMFVTGMREALASDASIAAPGRDRQRRVPAGWRLLERPVLQMALPFAALFIAGTIFWPAKTKLPPVAAVTLTAMRGEMQSAQPARETDITLGDVAPGAWRVQVVNAQGQPQWSGTPEVQGTAVEVKIRQTLGAGEYFIRLSNPEGKVVHEYGLRVRN